MGADIIIEYVPFREQQVKAFKIITKKMINAVNNLSLKKNKLEIENYYMEAYGEIEKIADFKDEFRKTIYDFFECLNWRDVTYIKHKGDIIYITGGMSWGDNPTDSFSIFHKFINLPNKILKERGYKYE